MKAVIMSVLSLCLSVASLHAAQRQIDPAQSSFTIYVGRAGLLAAAGHDHVVTAPIAEGAIDDGEPASVNFRVESVSLTVLPEDHQTEVQQNMQERVLESSSFPDIRFASTQVQPAGNSQWDVIGQLTLHGQTHPVHLHVRLIDGKYSGSTSIKQTSFGIQPVSAGGGTVKVKDELKIDFSIVAK